jgi:hypothetical protein
MHSAVLRDAPPHDDAAALVERLFTIFGTPGQGDSSKQREPKIVAARYDRAHSCWHNVSTNDKSTKRRDYRCAHTPVNASAKCSYAHHAAKKFVALCASNSVAHSSSDSDARYATVAGSRETSANSSSRRLNVSEAL